MQSFLWTWATCFSEAPKSQSTRLSTTLTAKSTICFDGGAVFRLSGRYAKVQGWQPGEVQANAVTDAEAFKNGLNAVSQSPGFKSFPTKFTFKNLDEI